MPELPKEILEARLTESRFGTIVRASLSSPTRNKIRSLKTQTNRTFQDFFRVFLSIYKFDSDWFPETNPRRKKIITFRLSKKDASDALDWAWLRNEYRKYFLGTLAETFFARVPFLFAREFFREQADLIMRIAEETVPCSNLKMFLMG